MRSGAINLNKTNTFHFIAKIIRQKSYKKIITENFLKVLSNGRSYKKIYIAFST